MDSTPGVSLFQGADIQINNSKNVEEEEDLEDQIRRKEELQNLLQANLDDFNYDDSTINSSTNISLHSNGNFEQLYKEAITPDEQLIVLYEVRCRELQNLRNEYDKFKQQKQAELSSQINQKLLLESELQQLRISLKNSENLLADKTGIINELNKSVEEKELQINKLKDLISSYERDVEVYKSEIAELHVKVQSQTFNLDAKYGSEELKKSLEHKIDKLENELEAQTSKTEIWTRENQALQDEVHRLVLEKNDLENDNAVVLSNFDAAQKQCRELIEVIQALKHENDYYKDRVNEVLSRDSLLKDSSGGHNSSRTEALRKMLVDKSVELDSCKVKLKSYEGALKDITEYRQLKSDVLKKEFKQCNNQSHTRDLLVLQNELRNYQRQLEEKTKQITDLHSNNKDLKEKIEEMLIQTRTEIQNISCKYNMPKLEIMKQELENLTRELEESEEQRFSLIRQLEILRNNDELEKLKNELDSVNTLLANERQQNLKLSSELKQLKLQQNNPLTENNGKTDYEALKMQLRNVMQHLEEKTNEHQGTLLIPKITAQMRNFLTRIEGHSIEKGLLEENIHSWIKMLQDVVIETNSDETLKAQYKEAVINLRRCEEKNKELEETIQELKNTITIGEGEKCGLGVQLENAKKVRMELERTIGELKLELRSREDELKKTGNSHSIEKDLESLTKKLKVKEDELVECQERLKRYEEEKKETKKWLENVKNEMEKLRNENGKLVEEIKISRNDTRVEEDLVKSELKLRDELQLEYQSRIKEIEKRYEKAFKETTDLCKQQKAELEAQDKKLREYLKVILTECESCTTRLEHEKLELNSQIELLRNDLEKCKSKAQARESIYQIALKKLEKEGQKTSEEWKEYSKKVVCSCLDIEATNKKVRDSVLASMDKYDNEIESIRNMFDSKAARKTKKSKTPDL